jgi:hypothetical protein
VSNIQAPSISCACYRRLLSWTCAGWVAVVEADARATETPIAAAAAPGETGKYMTLATARHTASKMTSSMAAVWNSWCCTLNLQETRTAVKSIGAVWQANFTGGPDLFHVLPANARLVRIARTLPLRALYRAAVAARLQREAIFVSFVSSALSHIESAAKRFILGARQRCPDFPIRRPCPMSRAEACDEPCFQCKFSLDLHTATR